MPSLAEGQSRFIACLQKGPAHFPDDMFAEDKARALLGLKAHANTISHARLVALENAYPKLHEHLGHEKFHGLSRAYVEQDHILTCDLNIIAAGFADFVQCKKYGGTEIDLARVEWAWIESYHAAEAEPVALADIAVLDEASLLGFAIEAHPAMRLIDLTGALSPQLSELGAETPYALLVARPEAQVLFHPLTQTDHAIAEKIVDIATLGNLLDAALELSDEALAMQHVMKLIEAGALTRSKR
tara:strand:+ start:1747 stop:2475 length:729 start_codon:yes stop_codon:yes gene_type:complete